MMDYKPIIYIWKQIKSSVIMSIIILIMLLMLPVKNIITIPLLILSVIYIKMILTKKPVFKEWWSVTWRITLYVVSFLLLWQFLGSFGVIGFVLGIVLFAAYRIYQGWDLFDATTTWGAKILKGERDAVLDLGGGLKNEEGREVTGGSEEDSHRRGDSKGEGESCESVSGFQLHKEDSVQMQELLLKSDSECEKRGEVQTGDALSELQKPLFPRIERRGRKKKII